MANKTIAVIGRSGQVSCALQRAANARSIPLLAAGRPHVDVGELDSIAAFLQSAEPALVINAAAYTSVDDAEDHPEEAGHTNVKGPAALAAYCAAKGLPLVQLSTDYVFNGLKGEPYEEDDEVCPLGTYGASKVAGEMAVASVLPRHIILRTSWVYGPDGSNFARTMLRLAREREELKVVNDQHGSPTLAGDLAHHILEIAPRLIEAPDGDRVWGTYHLAGSGETTWHGLAAEIFRLGKEAGLKVPKLIPIPSSEFPLKAPRPADSRLSTQKFQKIFGACPKFWQDSLADAFPEIADSV